MGRDGEKRFVAKDLAEVNKIVTEIMPLLEDEYSSEEAFDKAFDEAAK